MKFKIILLLVLCFIFSSCNVIINENEKIRAQLNLLINMISKELSIKHKMVITSFGAQAKNEKLYSFEIGFSRKQGVISQNECRKILLDCILMFKNTINANSIFKKVFYFFPIDYQNIEISIINSDIDGNEILYPEIKGCMNYKNKIIYYMADKSTYGVKSDITETYEEALEKLN